MLSLFNIVIGGVLLLTGRKLFWLLVGAIGFVIGIQAATRFFRGSEVTMLVAGLVLGIVFALLALFLESVAIGLAGFLGGGYILLSLAALFGLDKGMVAIIIFVVGGILGSILIASLLDWALIIISSLAGSSMIMNALNLKNAIAGLAFFVLLAVGIGVQASAMHRDRHTVEHPHND